MTDLRSKWPNFNAAVAAQDWKEAALHSRRASPISAERNQYVRSLLEQAAKEEARLNQ